MSDNTPKPNNESENLFASENLQRAAKLLDEVVIATIKAWQCDPPSSLPHGIHRIAAVLQLLDTMMNMSPPIFACGLLTHIIRLENELTALKVQQTNAATTPKSAPITDDIHINVPPLAVN